MKMVLVLALVAIVGSAGMSAQGAPQPGDSPEGQFGVGATVGSVTAAQLQYAITAAFHVGASLGLAINDGSTNFLFGPYGKLILAGSREFKPYLIGQLMINRSSRTVATVSTSSTSTSLVAGAGAEYFVTHHLGIFATIPVLMLPFEDGATVSLGILSPTLGVEWFF